MTLGAIERRDSGTLESSRLNLLSSLYHSNTTDEAKVQTESALSKMTRVHGVLVIYKRAHKGLYERVVCFAVGLLQLDDFPDILRRAQIKRPGARDNESQ
jgi:hypothetical protein